MQVKLGNGNYLITGRLGQDPELRQVGEKGSNMCTFSVAAGSKQSESGDKETIWINCKTWNNTAKSASTLVKGDVVMCIGFIEENEYEGKTYKNLVCDIVLMEPRFEEASKTTLKPSATKKSDKKADSEGFMIIDGDDDELPFN